MPRKTNLKKSVRRKLSSRKKFYRRVYKKRTYKKRTYKKNVSRIHKKQYGGAEQLTSKTKIGNKLLTEYRLADARGKSSWETDIMRIAENPVLVVEVKNTSRGDFGRRMTKAVGLSSAKYEIYIVSKIDLPAAGVFELTCDRYRYEGTKNQYIKDTEKVKFIMLHEKGDFDYTHASPEFKVSGNLEYKLYTIGGDEYYFYIADMPFAAEPKLGGDEYDFFILDMPNVMSDTKWFDNWQSEVGTPLTLTLKTFSKKKYQFERDGAFLIAKNKFLVAKAWVDEMRRRIPHFAGNPAGASELDESTVVMWKGSRVQLGQNSVYMQEYKKLEEEYNRIKTERRGTIN